MTLKLLHQTGHNLAWNVDSFLKDECGDGLIFSPVHQTRQVIEKLGARVRKASLFDPQFYLPTSQKSKFQTYNFFPETITGGYSDAKFTSFASQAARDCVLFQRSCAFERIVIPARYFSQMDPEYMEKQEAFSVLPFLAACQELKVKSPLLLSVPLTSHMLESKKYRTGLLNWITGFTEIAGVYVSVCNERDVKQAISTEYLSALLFFLHELRNAELEVIAGHLNTESLLLSLLGDVTITMGSFENTRMFQVDKFLVAEEERRGPRARVYLPGLLNWVQVDQAKQVRDRDSRLWSEVYWPTEYGDAALAAKVEPTFNQPDLYKHHFLCFEKQRGILDALDIKSRAECLNQWIDQAKVCYSRIDALGIEIERHGRSAHLDPWGRVIGDHVKQIGLV